MGELDIIRQWYAYNAQARRGYIKTFASLPREELSRDRGASYPSLMGILEHTLGAYYFWFAKMSTSIPSLPRFGPVTDDKEEHSLEDIDSLERQIQSHVNRFIGGLTEGDLDLAFRVDTGIAKHEYPISVRNALWHLVEEELQHRGELNALLWQMDVEAPVLDWNHWIESRSQVRKDGEMA